MPKYTLQEYAKLYVLRKRDKLLYREIGEQFGISAECTRHLYNKIQRMLLHPTDQGMHQAIADELAQRAVVVVIPPSKEFTIEALANAIKD